MPHLPVKSYKICVIIPTYNNEKTLKRVIDGVLSYIAEIYVINDGSTDGTRAILEEYPHIRVVHHPKNMGKGMALRTGFQRAQQDGFDYAITIDSDGQHYPKDIPILVQELLQHSKPVLLIGNRNMNQKGIPGKSSFGNRFSNFWFWFETGIQLEDTQSGFRAYPLRYLPQKLFTRKFEFEIEIIVRAAWKGILIKNVPIQVLYDLNERVSHFRPFQDFTRISILNTFLVCITLLYIKPRDFFRKIKKKAFCSFSEKISFS
jgi:glycosyltransferase involved in cell wall biosynthesis